MSTSDFLTNLRALHDTNVARRSILSDKIEGIREAHRAEISALEIEHSQADAAFQTSAGILEEAEKAFGGGDPAPGPSASKPAAQPTTEPAGRAKRGEIGGLILSTLREVPIAGMTEEQIVGALPQHKAGSVVAALKNAVKKKEVEEKAGRFFSAVDAAHDKVAAEAAGQTNGSTAPQPVDQPAAGDPSPALAQPSVMAEGRIINAIKAGPKTADELMDRCITLGGDAGSAKATLDDLVARRVVEMDEGQRFDFVGPA